LPAKRILIDLSHDEEVETIPDFIFKDEYEFELLEEGPITFEDLEDYDLLFIGNPQLAEGSAACFFTKEEIKDIKKFVAKGFGILYSSGAGGDRDFSRSLGSPRVLFSITGVTRFWNGTLLDKKNSIISPQNLIVKSFDPHFITRGLKEVVISESTFIDVTEDAEPLMYTEDDANFKYAADGEVDNVGAVPLLAVSDFMRGRAATIGCSKLFMEDSDVGYEVKDNKKLIRNLFSWLLFADDEEKVEPE
jgi:hypothetical protein